MEVSSHALELRRADAIHWAVGVFTNLTQDHLDFHPTMEDYFLAKRRLFEDGPRGARSSTSTTRTARRLAAELPGAIRVGIDAPDADLRATDIGSDVTGSTFRARRAASCARRCPGASTSSTCSAPSRAARALGVDDATIAAALPHAARVPGRFEPVDEGQDFAVLVDYAHTPDSLENVLRAARELAAGRVIVRLRLRRRPRPRQAPAHGRDRRASSPTSSIVTSDNPRSEDPEAIIAEIVEGSGPRRRGASSTAARRSRARSSWPRSGDVVVIAGKGHEQGQEFADGAQGALRRRHRRAGGAARARLVA